MYITQSCISAGHLKDYWHLIHQTIAFSMYFTSYIERRRMPEKCFTCDERVKCLSATEELDIAEKRDTHQLETAKCCTSTAISVTIQVVNVWPLVQNTYRLRTDPASYRNTDFRAVNIQHL